MFAKDKKLFGDVIERYRQLKLNLEDWPLRGDRDYALQSVLSAEVKCDLCSRDRQSSVA